MENLKQRIIALLKLNNTPREIALGVAAGVFIGITPVYGLHTIIVLFAAMLIPRTNKIAILLGSNISIPPTAPFISWTGYQIGRAILGRGYPDITWTTLKHFTYQEIGSLLYPLFLGSFILGVACALIFYFLILILITRLRKI